MFPNTGRDEDFIYREAEGGIWAVFANEMVEYRLDPESVGGDPCDGYSSADFVR